MMKLFSHESISGVKSNQLLALVAISVTFLFVGCGKSGLPCVKATCALTIDGKAFGPATAIFYREGAKPDDRRTSGNIERDGNGTLSTYQLGDGIPEGEYKVTVVTGGIGKSPVSKVYADPIKTPLKVTVFKNSDQIKLELEPIKSNSKDGNSIERLGGKSVDDMVSEAMDPSNQ